MTTRNRIFFPGNPWPEGHPIEEFRWTASVRNNAVWFDLHLRSEDYEAEREIEEPEEEGDEDDFPSDWEAPGVWTNYHRCTLSSTQWPNYRGFAVCPLSAFSLERIDGFEACVDDAPPEDPRDNAFHIYCPELEVRKQNLSMLARMSSADLAQWNGFGLALLSRRYCLIACSS
jgi:hypothetical protein